MCPPSPKHPSCVRRLFWDVDPETVDLDKHRDYVIERVMAHGTWEAMCWLRDRYVSEVLADFIRRRGARLAPREEAYWALITGVGVAPRRGGGRAPWVEASL